jgi:hypothetical protein
MNRRDTLYALLALGTAPLARAQQPTKIPLPSAILLRADRVIE